MNGLAMDREMPADVRAAGLDQQQDGLIDFPVGAPAREQVHRALKKYARFSRATADSDEGDVAAALREELRALQPARAAATEQLLGD
jgi:hypothetical protein